MNPKLNKFKNGDLVCLSMTRKWGREEEKWLLGKIFEIRDTKEYEGSLFYSLRESEYAVIEDALILLQRRK